MAASALIPAAQYLRMSTEHQQYSLDNQAAAIHKYAESRGFKIVRSYEDAGKSGLVLRHRKGLTQLLQDVVSGTKEYRAILVYDVSRWGRFQDADESAHYEYLCKSAGIPVHYCAEQFVNDGSLPNLLMKALKRTMAGEYSRELGVKVYEGLRRLAEKGCKLGGVAGYGLRRFMVSADGTRQQVLKIGEYKHLSTDRVILIHGPEEEVRCVREMFRLVVEEKRTPMFISRRLNQLQVPCLHKPKWTRDTVQYILTNPKYKGWYVWGRTSQKLKTSAVRLPASEWIITKAGFEPIISEETFEAAQSVLRDRTFNKTNNQFLDAARRLLAERGKLTTELFQAAPYCPSPSAYRRRFGELQAVYDAIGYTGFSSTYHIRYNLGRRTRKLREEIVTELVKLFPTDLSLVRKNRICRPKVRLQNGRHVCVRVAPYSYLPQHSRIGWRIEPRHAEDRLLTLLCRSNKENTGIMDMHLLPNMNAVYSRWSVLLKERDPRLKGAVRVRNLRDFMNSVRKVTAAVLQLS